MTRSLDDALARAVLAARPHTYTDQEIAAAESRIAARIAARDPGHRCPPRSGCCDDEAVRLLEILCRTVIGQGGALRQLSAFLGGRVPHPFGARVLGCALQLAGRDDGARFWWQFAAGAGDGAAAYCLYLHHLTLGEEWEAELWHRQSPPGKGNGNGNGKGNGDGDGDSGAPGTREGATPGAPADECPPGLVLRVLTGLLGDQSALPEAAAAVVHYVPDAVRFVDEVELPLPDADFAQRIEELTTAR
ncbi:hypothetical protein RM780_20175 [Streptomyces sp. DSM 44917]|uniref:Uncharacterized protein n=1 Tax=Streptomyces boetiae TaxID=3075541 RepID=A0ABU2LCF6_9ACTN|nr:hypothetical protein [Streptomyces sp. DSM 44917]MDT0309261.1 hypothetical protein [Streptomyces sp. DSM 44917]